MERKANADRVPWNSTYYAALKDAYQQIMVTKDHTSNSAIMTMRDILSGLIDDVPQRVMHLLACMMYPMSTLHLGLQHQKFGVIAMAGTREIMKQVFGLSDSIDIKYNARRHEYTMYVYDRFGPKRIPRADKCYVVTSCLNRAKYWEYMANREQCRLEQRQEQRTEQRFKPDDSDKSAQHKHRSRSPQREQHDRHKSRSPRRHKSRSPRRHKSRSPRRHKSRSRSHQHETHQHESRLPRSPEHTPRSPERSRHDRHKSRSPQHESQPPHGRYKSPERRPRSPPPRYVREPSPPHGMAYSVAPPPRYVREPSPPRYMNQAQYVPETRRRSMSPVRHETTENHVHIYNDGTNDTALRFLRSLGKAGYRTPL